MLCHQLKCLFVHIPKTAGQSIEQALMQRLGAGPEDRPSLLLVHNPDRRRGPPRLAHLTAAEYLELGYLNAEQFDSYYKFSIVRNPWARLVSEYNYRRHYKRFDFRTFVLRRLPQPGPTQAYRHVMPQRDYLFDARGRQLVDFIGRLENIDEDYPRLRDRLGLPPGPLPHVNRSAAKATRSRTGLPLLDGLKRTIYEKRRARRTFAHYTRYYDAETRDRVTELYADDIRTFGYRFGD
ncbi:MAG: sulfotransferase family 2 domain-containing protein [Pseudomonadota bacterium]